MPARIEAFVVHSHADREIGAGGRSRDDDEAGPGHQVGGGLVGHGEVPGGLDHDVDAEPSPRQARRIGLTGQLEIERADPERAIAHPDARRDRTLRRVMGQQIAEHGGIVGVVDGHHVDELWTLKRGPYDAAPDASDR